ncbi:hypothetical protein AQJ66_35195 [Streptomyces bungoensis]|uniref:Lipoprotein n=1 Tax=Streptomyces bungoensis TaxID=285568 RepID=A0A101SLA8_9ACTN|nr:hypothetical protein [Streptomyces bungoensis]KUN75997.1 hypothetical protein AQJ66_35195 [Streptomyces bungoensis]
MPYPPPPGPPGPRRRTLLASAVGAALLAGCSAGPDSGGSGAGPSATARARARAARDSSGLLARYDAVLAAHPSLAQRLRPLRAQVAAHVAAFGGRPATASPSAAARVSTTGPSSWATTPPAGSMPSVTDPPAGSSSPVPAAATEKDALASLAAAERSLADRRAEALLDVPGELARLLASVAAAGAAHAYLLTEGAR